MAIYQGDKKVGYNITNTIYSICPIGTILSYGGSDIPKGYLLCDGKEVNKVFYSDLYKVIGNTYGTATNNNNFVLPNLKDKFIQGAGTNAVGTEMGAGLPNITGDVGYLNPLDIGNYYEGINKSTGCFTKSGNILTTPSAGKCTSNGYLDTEGRTGLIKLDASSSNSIYGNSETVQPPSICLNYIIKAVNIKDTSVTEENKEIYSTDEIKTNKVWIDGKPIYRKVVTQTITTPDSKKIISDFDTSLIDAIISIYGSIRQPWGNIAPISYYNSEEDGAFIYMSKEEQHNRFVLNARTTGDVILIVEYTKTID